MSQPARSGWRPPSALWPIAFALAAIVLAALALKWHTLWWIALVVIVVGGIGFVAGLGAQEGESRADPDEEPQA